MKILKHIVAIIFALGLIFLILVILDEAEKEIQNEARSEETTGNQLKSVSIINISPTSSYALIQSFAEIRPHRSTTLKAKKRGEILALSNNLEVGKKVSEGELLFTFDNTHYLTLLAEAHNQIAQAELLIQSEKEQARLVRQDWKILRKKGKPSAFMLRIPQIKAAKAQLNLAKTNLNEIKRTVSYSKIVAPYNGVIASRSANVGEVVEAGQTLAEVISTNTLDVALKLNNQQWSMLDKKWKGQVVDVFSVNSTANNIQKWTAIIERKGGSIDKKTRQRVLHLRLNSSHKPLSGSFVRVEIRGKKFHNLLKLPQSGLTPQGYIWLVDSENKLRRFQASPLFFRGQSVFVKLPNTVTKSKSYSIVISPLSSFFVGVEVLPKKKSQ